MSARYHSLKTSIPVAIVLAALAVGCASTPEGPSPVAIARGKLTALQSDQQLATRAAAAIRDADLAVRAAEEAERKDKELTKHLVVIADRKIDTAAAQANTRLLEDQRLELAEQEQAVRLASRTREADRARSQADIARANAESARADTASARADAAEAQRMTEELRLQIAELNAKETERGLVVTLGDVLFDSGQAQIKSGAANNLDKLAAFLVKYKDRSVTIEGHTDSVGETGYNQSLSQRRADAVRSYLSNRGVDSNRLIASGMGESYPLVGNETAAGRQQNRRVEVIIANTVASLE